MTIASASRIWIISRIVSKMPVVCFTNALWSCTDTSGLSLSSVSIRSWTAVRLAPESSWMNAWFGDADRKFFAVLSGNR